MVAAPFHFQIGCGAWKEQIRRQTAKISRRYWHSFRVASQQNIAAACERVVNRQLSEDLKLFLMAFGAGNFPDNFGGDIYTPAEIIAGYSGQELRTESTVRLWRVLASPPERST